MLKIKYYRISKEEKKELKKKYYNTDTGKNLKKRLDRLFLTGILGIIFSLLLIIFNETKWDIISGVTLLVASLFFIYKSYDIRIKNLNEYLISKGTK